MQRSRVRVHRRSSFPPHPLPWPPPAARQTHFQESRRRSVVGDPSHLVGAHTDCLAHVRMSCAQESSSLRHRNTPSAATLAVGASPLTCSLADERKRYPQCCAHAQSRHEGASSAQASLTQSSAPRTRSRTERARGALVESKHTCKHTRKCGSSAEAAMAPLQPAREAASSGEMEDFGCSLS